MKTSTKSNPRKQDSLKEHRLIFPKPRKYTYADLSNFHRTVIAILNSKKRHTLDQSDYITVMQYICIVTNLLDLTPIQNLAITQNLQDGNAAYVQYPLPKIKGIGVISRSKKCLRELINWMKEVVTIEDLSLEILLDEYYTKFPYALKPSVALKADPLKSNPLKNKNKSSGKL